MARPNYSFEKRQRELKKNRKKEEKRQKKEARQAEGGEDSPDNAETDAGTDPADTTRQD